METRKCKRCGQVQGVDSFLPRPESTERHEECVSCLLAHYRNLVGFLSGAVDSPCPARHIEETAGEVRKAGLSLTCLQIELPSMKELKSEARKRLMCTDRQQRLQNLLSLEFKCAASETCAFRASAMERSEEGVWILQISKDHDCDERGRNLNSEFAEIEAFCRFARRLESYLPREISEETARWLKDYRSVSAVYKQIQDCVHRIEDEVVVEVWGLPCRWRRARGEANQPPQDEDLSRLLEIARERNLGDAVQGYIAAGLRTESSSSYFQQRGYFILLGCSGENNLRRILRSRIQVMLYAANLLLDEMFLLCRNRLNTTILRNHACMVVWLLQALRSTCGFGTFPLIGETDPKDSDLPDFYRILDGFGEDFFRGAMPAPFQLTSKNLK